MAGEGIASDLIQALEDTSMKQDHGYTRVIDLNQVADTHAIPSQHITSNNLEQCFQSVQPNAESQPVGDVVLLDERPGRVHPAARQQLMESVSHQLQVTARNAALSNLTTSSQGSAYIVVNNASSVSQTQQTLHSLPSATVTCSDNMKPQASLQTQRIQVLPSSMARTPQRIPCQIMPQPSPHQHVAGGNIIQLQSPRTQQAIIRQPQQVQQPLSISQVSQYQFQQPLNVAHNRFVVMPQQDIGTGDVPQHRLLSHVQSPNNIQPKNVLRPARFIAGENEPDASHIQQIPSADSGVNIQLVQTIRDMSRRNPHVLQGYSPVGSGQQVALSKIMTTPPLNKQATPVQNVTPQGTKLKQLLARGTLEEGTYSPEGATGLAHRQIVTPGGIQYVMSGPQNTPNCLVAMPVSQNLQIQSTPQPAQAVIVNSDRQVATGAATNNKSIQVIVPGTNRQHFVVQRSQVRTTTPGALIAQNNILQTPSGLNNQSLTTAKLLSTPTGTSLHQTSPANSNNPIKRLLTAQGLQVPNVNSVPVVSHIVTGAPTATTLLRSAAMGQLCYTTAASPLASQTVSSSTDVSTYGIKPESSAARISQVNDGDAECGKYVKGQVYSIKYNNGTALEVVWDGKYFKPKTGGQGPGLVTAPAGNDNLSPTTCSTPGTLVEATPSELSGQVRGGGGGDKQQQRRVILKGNAPGLNMIVATPGRTTTSSAISTPLTNGGRKWNYSSAGKDKLARPPIHAEQETVNQILVPTKPPKPKKERQEGKFAVCEHCGQLTSDYDVCESCKKELPDEPKYYFPLKGQAPSTPVATNPPTTVVYTLTQVPKGKGTLIKGKFYGNTIQMVPRQGVKRACVTKRPVGRRKILKKFAEPETVTILSSDDEEAHPATPCSDKMPNCGVESTENSTDPSPGASPASKQQSRRFKMEDSSGKIVLKLNAASRTPTPPSEDGEEVAHLVNPRSVKLGSLRTTAHGGVTFNKQGLLMSLTPEGSDSIPVKVVITPQEIIYIQANFGRQFPVLMMYVSADCAKKIRNLFLMSSTKGPYFDPTSQDESQKRIIILAQEFPKDFPVRFRAMCKMYEAVTEAVVRPYLQETDSSTANQLLMLSVPKDVVNSVKEQQGQIVARQKIVPGHAIVSQVIVSTQGTNQPLTLITTIPITTEHRDINEDEDDDEPVDRSRSPSPIMNIFSGPIIKLFTYPPPPATGGITVTNEDLFCLNEGEFLNDVIIDFYLKYLFTKILQKDQDRTHVFSSFFYRRLTQKDTKRRTDDVATMTAQEKRHNRVRTWTRHVDLFSKDFIIVPINESAHWYLAIICYPYLQEPKRYNKTVIVQSKLGEGVAKPTNSSAIIKTPSKGSAPSTPSSSQSDAEKAHLNVSETEADGKSDTPQKMETEENDKPEKQEAAAPTPSKSRTVMSKMTVPGIEKQPCILVFDSLSGPSRSSVVRTLREYLQVEWDMKKKEKGGGDRVFDKDHIKGANPKCPQQTNYSDCGIYVLEYVESFFKRPIKDYSIPIKSLVDWFPDDHVATKRQELRDLILQLQKQLHPELEYDPVKDGCMSEMAHMDTSDTQQISSKGLNPKTDLIESTPIDETTLAEQLPCNENL